MQLYRHKPISYGFVVMFPNFNFTLIKNTLNSIKSNYKDKEYISIFPKSVPSDLIKEISKISKIYISDGNNFSSLISDGMKNCFSNWNFFVCGNGAWLKPLLDRKYSSFIENEKDILYPMIARRRSFIQGGFNSFLIHSRTISELKKFPTYKNLEINSVVWTNKAIENGCKFKAIYGANFF